LTVFSLCNIGRAKALAAFSWKCHCISPRPWPLTEFLSGVSEPPLLFFPHRPFVPLDPLGTNPRVRLGTSLPRNGIPLCIRSQQHRFQCDTLLASSLLPRSTPSRQQPPLLCLPLSLWPSVRRVRPARFANDSWVREYP